MGLARPGVAPVYARDGGRIDRPHMDTERGLAVSGTTLATARGGVSKQRGWEAEEICALYKWIMK
jgi:hypothetical protein